MSVDVQHRPEAIFSLGIRAKWSFRPDSEQEVYSLITEDRTYCFLRKTRDMSDAFECYLPSRLPMVCGPNQSVP